MTRKPPRLGTISTLAMVTTAEARGFDAEDLLAAAGLSRQSLADPDARVPAPVVLAVWQALRARTGDPALQLAAPVTLPWGTYRVADYLTAASATVADGVHRFARYFGLITDAVTLTVTSEGDEHSLCMAMADGGPVPFVYVDYVFAAFVGRVRILPRPQLELLRVELRQAAPADETPYTAFYRAPVRFGAARDRLCFSDAEWNAPMVSADAALAQLLEDHARILRERLPEPEPGFATEVARKIACAPPEAASVEHIARATHMSVRTLQRKLIASGTTFREVCDTVRGQLSQEYLADPRVSIAEVAFLLGFSEQSSFNRAFRRWTGESPGRWRRQRLPGNQAGR